MPDRPRAHTRTVQASSVLTFLAKARDVIAYLIVTLSYRAFRKQDESICGRRLRSRCAR
jgi:hypothetical protein